MPITTYTIYLFKRERFVIRVRVMLTTNSYSYCANTMQEIIEKHKNVLYSIHTIELELAYSIYGGENYDLIC